MIILVAKEKHGDRYFEADTNEKLHKACIKLINERLSWYDITEFLKDVKSCIKSEMKLFRGLPTSFMYLQSREVYEYESVELVETEEC